MYFEIYQQAPGLLSAGLPHPDYRWRLWSDNGRIIANSSEGYRNKSDCQHGIDLVKGTFSTTPVVDRTASNGLVSLSLLAAALRLKT